jgi:hypothetical protein
MTMTLHDYQQDVQRLLREQKQILANPTDLTRYINRARREVAMRSQAIRFLTTISAPIVSCEVTAGGTGYTNPTVTISDPDFPSGAVSNPNGRQATALATVQAGVIVGIDITDGGDGYFQPLVTITDSTGSGATAELTIGPITSLNAGQEQYKFSDIDVSAMPGVGAVYFVRSASIIYSNYRFSLPSYSFSVYQSRIRNYPAGAYQYVPTFMSQFGQGVGGSLFFFPLPSQQYQIELDCSCLPSDLVTNQSVEALPEPWTDAVMYFAAHFAMLEMQNLNAAKGYLELYEKFAQRYSDYSRAGRVTNPYGRWITLVAAIPAALEFLRCVGGIVA